MRIGAGLAGISIGLMWLLYMGIFGGLIGGAASWLGSLGSGNESLSNWGAIVQLLSLGSPILTLVGGIVTFSRPRLGGILIGISGALAAYLLGFGFIGKIVVIPLAVVAILALLAAPPRRLSALQSAPAASTANADAGPLQATQHPDALAQAQKRRETIVRVTQVLGTQVGLWRYRLWSNRSKRIRTVIALALVAGVGFAASEWTSKARVHTRRTAAQATAPDLGPARLLCETVASSRAGLQALRNQVRAESNPLRRDTLQANYRAEVKRANATVKNFVANLEMTNYVGKITQMDLMHYNTGPGVLLGITLPCNIGVSFQLLEIKNPGWGGIDPKDQADLTPFRAALEQIAVNDTVTFSARSYVDYRIDYAGTLQSPTHQLTLAGVLRDLRKGAVTAQQAPPFTADDAARLAKGTPALPAQLIVQMARKPRVSTIRNWENWQKYAGAYQALKSTVEQHGWITTGLVPQSVGYYSVNGTVDPPEGAKQTIISGFNQQTGQYNAVLLNDVEITSISASVDGHAATATISARYIGCTSVCELWKSFRQHPGYVGSSLFVGYNPAFDFNSSYQITVKYSWDPDRGWHYYPSDDKGVWTASRNAEQVAPAAERVAVAEAVSEAKPRTWGQPDQIAQTNPKKARRSTTDASRKAKAADPSCATCGVITAITPVKQEGQPGVAGTLLGAAIGGLAGSKTGKGDGQKAMAILGALAGAAAGREAQKKIGEKTTYEVTVQMTSGASKQILADATDGLTVGARVKVIDGKLTLY